MSSVVAAAEVLKLLFCCCVVFLCPGSTSQPSFLRNFKEYRALAIPSSLYVVQNNAQFIAIQCLSPVVYIVLSQAKILTTAIFSVLLFGTALNKRKCTALLLLAFGLVFINIPPGSGVGRGQSSCYNGGLLASAVAAITSGFSSVFLELCFKKGNVSLWERNIQLGIFSVPIAWVSGLFDPERSTCSIFGGFDGIVICVVFLQAAGGIVVAHVIKHADSIIKNFSVAVSICTCTLYTMCVNHIPLTPPVMIGVSSVILSVFMYSLASRNEQ